MSYKNDIDLIIDYIKRRNNISSDNGELKKIAASLIRKDGFTVKEVYDGKADKEIGIQLYLCDFTKNSVAKNENDRDKQVLKAKKKNKPTKTFLKALVVALAIAGSVSLYFHAKDKVTELQTNKNVEENIAILAQGFETTEMKNLVNQHKYVVGYEVVDGRKQALIAYFYDEIAQTIVNICSQDSELFDVVLSNCYFDFENRLSSMDNLLVELKKLARDNEELSYINDKFEGCGCFLDYLLSRKCGLVEEGTEEYAKLENAIQEYKVQKSESAVGNGYSALDDEKEQTIDDLIEKYKKRKNELNDEYNIRLQNLANEKRAKFIDGGDTLGTRS